MSLLAAVVAAAVKLVGMDSCRLVVRASDLLNDPTLYLQVTSSTTP